MCLFCIFRKSIHYSCIFLFLFITLPVMCVASLVATTMFAFFPILYIIAAALLPCFNCVLCVARLYCIYRNQ